MGIKEPKQKQFSLSEVERMNLAGRDAIAGQHEYVANLVRSNMEQYVETVIKPRLGIAGKPTRYDIDNGKIYVIEISEVEVKEGVQNAK